MTLFQPDTKAKNLFLSKLAILVDKPILFDLYRFGTNFEFKYGLVSNVKTFIEFLKKMIPLSTWSIERKITAKPIKASTRPSPTGYRTSRKASVAFRWPRGKPNIFPPIPTGRWNPPYQLAGRRLIAMLLRSFSARIRCFPTRFLILNKSTKEFSCYIYSLIIIFAVVDRTVQKSHAECRESNIHKHD